MSPENLPHISIIIPAYNEAQFIQKCLEALISQNYPKELYEIILVDNGSTDKTVQIAKRYTLNVYVCPGLTIAGLRNYGAKLATGEIYAFIDADCVADQDWLLNAAKSLAKKPFIIGSMCDIPQNSTWIERAWFSRRPHGRREVMEINSGNMIVPRSIFRKLGGFNDPLITGEDSDFCARARQMGAEVISDVSVQVVHLGNPKTIKAFLEREIWHGFSFLGVLRSKRFEKSALSTLAFSLLMVLQIAGGLLMAFNGSSVLLIYSSMGIVFLVLAAVFDCVKKKSRWIWAGHLTVLYYLYFLGRFIALFRIVMNKSWKRTKEIHQQFEKLGGMR